MEITAPFKLNGSSTQSTAGRIRCFRERYKIVETVKYGITIPDRKLF